MIIGNLEHDPFCVTVSRKSVNSVGPTLAPSHAQQDENVSSPGEVGKGPGKLVRRSTIGVPGEATKPQKPDTGRPMSKFKASVGRVIMGQRAIAAFKQDRKFEDDEEEPPELVDEPKQPIVGKVSNKELLKRVVTSRRWLFMDCRKALKEHKDEKPPKNLGELLRLVFVLIHRGIHRQELKRRAANVFWEALANRKPAELRKPEKAPPVISTTLPQGRERASLNSDTTSVIASKLQAIQDARRWIEESNFTWQQREDGKHTFEAYMDTFEALSESGKNHLDDLTNLRDQIERGLISAAALKNSMAHLMNKQWVVHQLNNCQGELQVTQKANAGNNGETGEDETKHRNEKEVAFVEEPAMLIDDFSSADEGSISTSNATVVQSGRGQQQLVQRSMPRGSKAARAKARPSSKPTVPTHTQKRLASHWDTLRVVDTTARMSSKQSVASAPGVMESTEPNEELRNKCLEELALVESLWNGLWASKPTSGDAERSKSPASADNLSRGQEKPIIVVANPVDLTHDGAEVPVQPLAESEIQQRQTEQSTDVVVQHGGPTTTIVSEESESVVVPSCSNSGERQTARPGPRRPSRRSTTTCLDVPSGDRLGSDHSTPWSLSKEASSKAEEAPPRSSSKTASSNAEEVPQRSASKTGLRHTGEAPRRFCSTKSPLLLNDMVDAVDSPEGVPASPTEAAAPIVRRGRTFSAISACRTDAWQATFPGGRRDFLPLVVGLSAPSPCAHRPDSSTSSDTLWQDEQPLHGKAGVRKLAASPRPAAAPGSRNWRLFSRESVEEDEHPLSCRASVHGLSGPPGGTVIYRLLSVPQRSKTCGALEDRSVSVMGAAGRSSSKRSPETRAVIGSPRGSQPSSPLPTCSQDMRRLSSKRASDSGACLGVFGSGRSGSKSSTDKKGPRRASANSCTVLSSRQRPVPDIDCSGLVVKGAELMGA